MLPFINASVFLNIEEEKLKLHNTNFVLDTQIFAQSSLTFKKSLHCGFFYMMKKPNVFASREI